MHAGQVLSLTWLTNCHSSSLLLAILGQTQAPNVKLDEIRGTVSSDKGESSIGIDSHEINKNTYLESW